MRIVLRTIARGPALDLKAWGTEWRCDLYDFLEQLKASDADEFARLVALIDRCANHGLPRDTQKCRVLKGTGCFELKTRGGVRLVAFRDGQQLVICTQGFLKKSQKTPRTELLRAEERRQHYLEAKRLNQVQSSAD